MSHGNLRRSQDGIQTHLRAGSTPDADAADYLKSTNQGVFRHLPSTFGKILTSLQLPRVWIVTDFARMLTSCTVSSVFPRGTSMCYERFHQDTAFAGVRVVKPAVSCRLVDRIQRTFGAGVGQAFALLLDNCPKRSGSLGAYLRLTTPANYWCGRRMKRKTGTARLYLAGSKDMPVSNIEERLLSLLATLEECPSFLPDRRQRRGCETAVARHPRASDGT